MRSIFLPAQRIRCARLRWNPAAILIAWLLLAAMCVPLLAIVISERGSRVQDLRDRAWIAIMEKRTFHAEVVRPARDALGRALATPEPARIDWQQLGREGLLFAVVSGKEVRVLSRPSAIAEGLEQHGTPESDLVQRAGSARDPFWMGEQYCLALPGADAAQAKRVLALPRAARVVAASCFGAEALARAARAGLPNKAELSYYLRGQSVLRVSKDEDGEPAVNRNFRGTSMTDTSLDRSAPGVDLSTPSGALHLMLHGGSTVEELRSQEEYRPGGPQFVHYIGGGDGPVSTTWTGFSYTVKGDQPEPPSMAGTWLLLVALAMLVAVVVQQGYWSWRIAGRLTRRVRHRVARASVR